MDIENRIVIINSVLDCVKEIEQIQNSPDMQVYKKILMKLASTMINDFSSQSENVSILNENKKEPDFTGERPDNFNSENCQVYQDRGNNDCGCENGTCGIPQTDADLNRKLPEFNIQDTIALIKDEIDAESKD